MKKVEFMMSLLLTLGLFSACSNNDELDINGDQSLIQISDSTLVPDDGVVLSPYEFLNQWGSCKNDEENRIFYFFNGPNGQLPIGKRSNSFFVDSNKDVCYVINSIQELKSIYKGDKDLPEIDFKRWTLVIGQMVEPDAFYPVFKQELKFKDNKCQLTLYVPELDEVNLKGVSYKTQYLYYWALYPKFNTAGISVGYVKEGQLKSLKEVGKKDIGWLSHSTYWNRMLITAERTTLLDPLITDKYFPMNLPDEFISYQHVKFPEWRWVSISGYYFQAADDYYGGSDPDFNYIYLTDIEETECPLTKEFMESIGASWEMLQECMN